jgi:hypothetical protein
VEADLLLGFEHRNIGVLRKRGGSRHAGNAAADDQDVWMPHFVSRR